MEIEKKTIRAVATMMRALANETRLSILYKLYEGPKTWTELIFELNLNPKSLRDHLDYLRKNGLVEKRKPGDFHSQASLGDSWKRLTGGLDLALESISHREGNDGARYFVFPKILSP